VLTTGTSKLIQRRIIGHHGKQVVSIGNDFIDISILLASLVFRVKPNHSGVSPQEQGIFLPFVSPLVLMPFVQVLD
jgi:hypothetical protein